ncbi:MAG: DUF1517 domain-containing protein [Drouetiella hepatica Uher 2000/2452]|jgi:uncharacterized membrane protein|uniref:DUF1517 domain-containing protein n=1 Tax=Drouetiella hepatica Uher 2000/2452 TaxID=904376 RepID=A0A951UKG0_9CYAN|nr:DUF1517 domain-containing protein [Drouetiella hepatica Uher 2000/2452]
MGTLAKLRLLGTATLALVLVNSLGLGISQRADVKYGLPDRSLGLVAEGDRAEARSSGGRAGGGSFSRPSGGGSSAPSRSAPSYSNPAPYNPSYRDSYPRSYPVPVPIPGGYGGYGGYGYGIGGGFGSLLLLLIVGGGAILPIMWMYFMRSGGRGLSSGYGSGAAAGELDNDIVTVTRLQVALLAQARYIQENLTELTEQADTSTQTGLSQLLQETVLALLRAPENWTHVRVNSQTVKSREQAGQVFQEISIEERSKFSAETLANVGGRVQRQAPAKNDDDAPASYIVVTLILGTADDRPLFTDKILSAQDLQAALKRIGGISPDYLMVFELLWSPQNSADSLTYDELLTEYQGLVQIT